MISAAVGCRSTNLAYQPKPVEPSDFAAQFAALSNEVSRLNARLDSMEKESAEWNGSREFIQKLLEELRYEPVVESSLIGVSDGGNTNAEQRLPFFQQPESTPSPDRSK